MLNGPIPPHVDPRKLADRGISFNGSLPLSQFTRVCELLTHNTGDVQVNVSFSRDQQKAVIMQLDLNTEVGMVCQRCLEEAALPCQGSFSYAVIWPGTDDSQLPKGYDVLEVGEEPLDLHALVEDELLLTLPIVPMHPIDECRPPVELEQPELAEDEVKRSNPFSILAQLKRDTNV